MDVVTMEKIVALCKRRGFVFPASEIYGGIANTYDYGHYGVLLKRNVVDSWWRAMVFERDDIVALDSAIIQHPRTWEASGHLAGFTDPLVDCRTCKLRFRADHLEEARAGAPGREELRCGRAPSKLPGEHPDCDLTEARQFNLMFETTIGPVKDDASTVYLRPETAQGIFLDYKNVLSFARRRPKFHPHSRARCRPGEGRRLARPPPPGPRAGHLPRQKKGVALPPPAPAVRHRPGRQVVSQRDHARQLRLPDARVRADGDGVLRPARRGPPLVRLLARGAPQLVHAPGAPARPPAAARARSRRALALLVGHQRRRVPVSDRLAGARGHRQPGGLRPHAARERLRPEARVQGPADRRELRATCDRAGRGRRAQRPGVHVRRVRRGRDRRRASHRAAAAPRSRAREGRRAAAA